MLNFPPGAAIFAAAGLVAAAGPILIHLLNRRRYRVVSWAAMDFLLEAVQRNRKLLQLRDLLLLLLRTACLALFGLALARPYFSDAGAASSANQPFHAILLVDNSLSMGYQKLDGTLLDEAKARAKEFVDDLPDGSRISVVPLCGSMAGYSLDAYRTKEDARDALDKIDVADRSAGASLAASRALEASARVPDMPVKRVVLLGDQQLINWPLKGLGPEFKSLAEMQVVAIAPPEIENTWIQKFTLQDSIADVETPAVLTAEIRHEGPSPRSDVQVKLSIDGSEVSSSTINLEPGQTREVTFEHRFDVPAEPGRPLFLPVQVSIQGDRLAGDDSRMLAVPVVASLPVVFIDQYGRDEDPAKNLYGESRHLRRLLSPVTSRSDAQRPLVEIRHLKIDELDREVLTDARLVVIAGIASPEGAVPLLRDFVKQGGQLVIIGGAEFDPSAWNNAAWLDGKGILPAPFKPELVGKMPEEAGAELHPFMLSFRSMSHDYFQLADTSDQELEELYALPYFFKIAAADTSDEVLSPLLKAETQRIAEEQTLLKTADAHEKEWAEREADGTLDNAQREARDAEREQLAELLPRWLLWAQDRYEDGDDQTKPADLAERGQPRVLARYDNQLPFLVERRIGNGEVLLVTSGMFSTWNTLPKTNAMLLMDRILRAHLERTLPERNLSTFDQLTLPVSDRNAMYTLARPDGRTEPLMVEALGADAYGLRVRGALERGIYKVTSYRMDQSASQEGFDNKLSEIVLAVNGPATESEPAVIDEAGLRERSGEAKYRWVARGEPISLEGSLVRGQNLWKWLIAAVLACLLLELAVLAKPAAAGEGAK